MNIDPNYFAETGFQEMVLYSLNSGAVRGAFDPTLRLTQYKLLTNEIYAQEILS